MFISKLLFLLFLFASGYLMTNIWKFVILWWFNGGLMGFTLWLFSIAMENGPAHRNRWFTY